jgi:hypothetical protein
MSRLFDRKKKGHRRATGPGCGKKLMTLRSIRFLFGAKGVDF